MHNLKTNKVLHERVVLLNVRTETTPRVALANRYEMTSLSPDFMLVTLHFGVHGATAHPSRPRGDAKGRTLSSTL